MNQAQSIIENSINYIENHLQEKISLEEIAAKVGISKYHLHRLFKSLTGESIIGYTTSRKLSASVDQLLNSNMRIIDIALEYGFEHEQSYIRAFRNEFGRTPLKVRNSQAPIPVKEKINLNEIIQMGNAITYRPFFVVKPAFHLVGVKYVIGNDEDYLIPNKVGREFFYHQKSQIKYITNPELYIGYVDWGSEPNGYVTYIPSTQVDQLAEIPTGMSGITVPNHKYVVFRFVGFFHPEQVNIRHFQHLYEYMYFKWIFQAGYQFAASFRFEYIDKSIANDDYCEVDLYQPIIEKTE